uniref:Uncharacterized protein n=1 Tax=Anguilla anguilla TaxID=7936 RepID=A0A0E9SF93_ANGAN
MSTLGWPFSTEPISTLLRTDMIILRPLSHCEGADPVKSKFGCFLNVNPK